MMAVKRTPPAIAANSALPMRARNRVWDNNLTNLLVGPRHVGRGGSVRLD